LSSLALLMHNSGEILDSGIHSLLVLEGENVIFFGLGKILLVLFSLLSDVVIRIVAVRS